MAEARGEKKKVYAVTMRGVAEMVVWVEARSAAGAKLLADAGEYDVMSEWAPKDYARVRATKARLSKWPDGDPTEPTI